MIVPAGLAFTNFVILAIVVAALYFTRDILVPIALAVLLSVLLAPLVRLLQHWRLPRWLAVMCTVAGALYLANDRQDVSGVANGVGFGDRHSHFASLRELWAAQLHPASLSASPSIARARSDHCAFLLSRSGEKVEDEGVNICTKFSNNELHMLSHEARDEVRSFTPNGR